MAFLYMSISYYKWGASEKHRGTSRPDTFELDGIRLLGIPLGDIDTIFIINHDAVGMDKGVASFFSSDSIAETIFSLRGLVFEPKWPLT